MDKLSAIIVDDEPLALNFLRGILSKFPKIDIIAECKNGREAVAAVSKLSPDLLFLDIQMPGMNGFEVVKKIQSDGMPLVIFVTAYDQFATDAFDVHAVDYLLKPVDHDRVGRAIDRASARITANIDGDFKSPLIGAIDSISERLAGEKLSDSGSDDREQQGVRRKLLVRDSGVVKIIPFDDIDWVDAAGDYMCVHAAGDTHIIRITLGELMDRLEDKLFIRIHRSTIVNIERVVSITALPKGGSLLELSEGTTLKVSRNYRESVRKLFQ